MATSLPTENGRFTEDKVALPPRRLSALWRGSGGNAIPMARGRRLWIILLNWALILILVLGAGARVAWVLQDNRYTEAAHYPAAALAYLEANDLAGRRIYNSYNWGGYLLWRGYAVFIDGRADVYGDAFMDEYVLAYQLRGDWRRPLERYGVEVILIESGASLEALLIESDEWQSVYRDELAVVFLRRNAQGG